MSNMLEIQSVLKDSKILKNNNDNKYMVIGIEIIIAGDYHMKSRIFFMDVRFSSNHHRKMTLH